MWGLGRWHRTLCANRQACQPALVPATRGHSERSAAGSPGVSRPQAASRSRPPGSGGVSHGCSQAAGAWGFAVAAAGDWQSDSVHGLEEEGRRRRGPLSSITPRALRSPVGLIAADVELDHLADGLSGECVSFLRREGVLLPLPDAALGGRKPPTSSPRRRRREPLPRGGALST